MSVPDTELPAQPSTPSLPPTPSDALAAVLQAQLDEQRQARRSRVRWRIFSMTVFLILGVLMFGGIAPPSAQDDPHVAVVSMSGMIVAGGDIDAESSVQAFRRAIDNPKATAIVLRINSPGGSAVQSAIIHDELRRLRGKDSRPVYAVIEDLGASGGYYIAAAADKIYAHPSSLVGSIGVRLDGFGFTEIMKKAGVERRLLTSGENKAMLDPFLPEDPKQKARMEALLASVHEEFIAAVRESRKDRLSTKPEVLSGMVYTGRQAKEVGLVDDFRTLEQLVEEDLGQKVWLEYAVPRSLAELLGRQLGASMAQQLETVVRSVLRDWLGTGVLGGTSPEAGLFLGDAGHPPARSLAAR